MGLLFFFCTAYPVFINSALYMMLHLIYKTIVITDIFKIYLWHVYCPNGEEQFY